MSSSKKGSQFSGAAAMFRKKESEMLEKQDSMKDMDFNMSPKGSPRKNFGQKANASMGNLQYSPLNTNNKSTSLKAPPFVSPGIRKTEADKTSWKNSNNSPGGVGALPFGTGGGSGGGTKSYPTSSYLNKPSGTPKQTAKKRVSAAGFGGMAFSPSPGQNEKPKVNGKSWKDKIAFQAASPHQLKKKSVAQSSFSPTHYGGSYLSKDTKNRDSAMMPLVETPDIKIEVKIPDIDKKIRARRAAARPPPPKKEENVPEHIRKFREREVAKQKALDDKEYNAAAKLQAYVLGWKARTAYPALKKAGQARLEKIAKERAKVLLRKQSAITIQKTWRGYLPKKRYKYVMKCRKRRAKNKKEIKRIEKEISKMPKKTKSEIKEMKKKQAEKKKVIKRKLRKMMKEDDEKIEDIKKTGHDMIQYLQNENKKVKEQQQAVKNDYKVLEKQFDLLTEKSEDIARNFQSLQQFVGKKNATIQKHELNSQKCRHRYLPKYRAEVQDRNKHCIAEYRVKMLYKARLHRIMKEILGRSTDSSILEDSQEAIEFCEAELKSMPAIPIPKALEKWLET